VTFVPERAADRRTDLVPVVVASGGRPRVRWSALTYHLPARPSRLRVAVWRHLHRVSAVHLHHAWWAVGHDEDDDRSVRELADVVSSFGGDATAFVVTPARPECPSLERELVAACDHLWDPFFNDVDRVGLLVEAGHGSAAAAGLDRVRALYADILRHDLSRLDTADRASRRLRECEDQFCEAGFDALDVVGPGTRSRRTAGPPTVWQLDDGTVDSLLPVAPRPSIAWERAFLDFESAVYLPSPDRSPLEHGVFRFRCAPTERAGVVDRIRQRVQRFELSLG
jgi:hypothetical protein